VDASSNTPARATGRPTIPARVIRAPRKPSTRRQNAKALFRAFGQVFDRCRQWATGVPYLIGLLFGVGKANNYPTRIEMLYLGFAAVIAIGAATRRI